MPNFEILESIYDKLYVALEQSQKTKEPSSKANAAETIRAAINELTNEALETKKLLANKNNDHDVNAFIKANNDFVKLILATKFEAFGLDFKQSLRQNPELKTKFDTIKSSFKTLNQEPIFDPTKSAIERYLTDPDLEELKAAYLKTRKLNGKLINFKALNDIGNISKYKERLRRSQQVANKAAENLFNKLVDKTSNPKGFAELLLAHNAVLSQMTMGFIKIDLPYEKRKEKANLQEINLLGKLNHLSNTIKSKQLAKSIIENSPAEGNFKDQLSTNLVSQDSPNIDETYAMLDRATKILQKVNIQTKEIIEFSEMIAMSERLYYQEDKQELNEIKAQIKMYQETNNETSDQLYAYLNLEVKQLDKVLKQVNYMLGKSGEDEQEITNGFSLYLKKVKKENNDLPIQTVKKILAPIAKFIGYITNKLDGLLINLKDFCYKKNIKWLDNSQYKLVNIAEPDDIMKRNKKNN